MLPYKVVNKDGSPYIEVEVNGKPKQFSPEQISAMILGKMKDIAENYLGEEVKRAVVTVPAYFTEGQRKVPASFPPFRARVLTFFRPPRTLVPSPVSVSNVS